VLYQQFNFKNNLCIVGAPTGDKQVNMFQKIAMLSLLLSVPALMLALLGGSLEAEAVLASMYVGSSRTARISAASNLSAALLGKPEVVADPTVFFLLYTCLHKHSLQSVLSIGKLEAKTG
jgi:hypothetical protein